MKILRNVVITIVGLLAVVVVGVLALAYIPSPMFEPAVYEPIAPDYWPTDGFQLSTPEEQGMDSAKLVEMVEAYQQAHAKNPTTSIDSVTVVRNGYVVADLYFNPLYPEDSLHILHSSTKSIMSALIGIAIEQGHIESVDVPVVDFFQDKALSITDERITEVTVKDLLTMQTGVRSRDSYIYRWDGWFEMINSDDWVAHFFTLPMDVEPGTRFDYSNLASFMLSAVIHESTDMDVLEYARANLFSPLGIEDVQWETSPQGIAVGATRMWLKPHDMAKFGLLYLQKGQWDGQQVVPADWVTESVTPHAYPRNYVDVLDENGQRDYEASRFAWISNKFLKYFADGYGYQWWLDKNGNYNALGTAGQYLMVAPEENVVVMVTNSSSDMGVYFPAKLFYEYILPAIESNDALAANPDAQAELAALSSPPELKQEAQTVPELPAIAQEISGKTYTLTENRWNYDNFQLIFDPTTDHATFSYTAKVHDAASIAVGLDQVYRFTDTEMGTFAAYGSWTAPDTFELTCQHIGYTSPTQFVLTFSQDVIEVMEVGQTGSYTYLGKML